MWEWLAAAGDFEAKRCAERLWIDAHHDQIALTRIQQRIEQPRDLCVTLNRSEAIDPERVIRRIDYSHPVFTPEGVAAQTRHGEISGLHARTHYCGAYWGWGFHEDGARSALAACRPFGVGL